TALATIRVHHGYHDRGSNPVRLGGSSGGCVKPPARTGSMDGPGALTTLYILLVIFFLLVAREPLGESRGLGVPSRSDNACPARAFPVPRIKSGAAQTRPGLFAYEERGPWPTHPLRTKFLYRQSVRPTSQRTPGAAVQ